MDKILRYTLRDEDLEGTAGGLVNLVLKNCVQVTGHEISAAKFTPDGITCDGIQVRVTDRMRPGQTLQVVLPEETQEDKLIPAQGPVRVLYEDEDLIAVNKAAGEVVHPGPGHYTDTVANYVTGYLRAQQGENAFSGGLRVSGRLDKETSGILIFAKNRAAAARLQRQRRDGLFVRTYLAVCEGLFEEKEGDIDRPLEKVPGVLMKMRVAESGGLPALTHYEVAAQKGNASLLRVTIRTGRTHQIRVHMASIGHPLVGDTLYGSEIPKQNQMRETASSQTENLQTGGVSHVKSMPEQTEDHAGPRALLHAYQVCLLQPFTKDPIHISTPPPEDFAEFWTEASDSQENVSFCLDREEIFSTY